ncbi:hypothetical protein ACI2LC_13555 [Nonomuraea wenchangensis]|jgi:hypothetical protein|uniref:Uncharacterized protein n=2 Tax=Nonomuraea TaxID=83681 RepID=A0A1I0CZ68_9ACTN|nr:MULTISPECIES: hypothetical protein [Nonomuraea]MED7930164.1 hypothetical protein [Nonomuraea sp. LP-02]SET25154.1 hypothetical protein SAMN05421811_102515 [Nonomuraea wenchangensis]
MNANGLESLPAHELHERAVRYAVRHGDLGFLWELLKVIPAAEAASGHETDADLTKVSALLADAIAAGEGELGEALRPVYLSYLREHPDA